MLFYIILYYIILCYVILYYIILCYLILYYIILYYIILYIILSYIILSYLSIYPSIYLSISLSLHVYICIIHVIYIFTKNIRFNDFFLSPQGSGRSPSYHQSSEPKRRGKVPRDGGKASAAAQIFPRFFCFRIVFLSFNFGQVEDSQTVQENHNKHTVLGNSLQGNHPIFGGCSADMKKKLGKRRESSTKAVHSRS